MNGATKAMHYILRACLGKSKDVLKVCLFKEIRTLAEKGGGSGRHFFIIIQQ